MNTVHCRPSSRGGFNLRAVFHGRAKTGRSSGSEATPPSRQGADDASLPLTDGLSSANVARLSSGGVGAYDLAL